jgi:hypothetical protein
MLPVFPRIIGPHPFAHVGAMAADTLAVRSPFGCDDAKVLPGEGVSFVAVSLLSIPCPKPNSVVSSTPIFGGSYSTQMTRIDACLDPTQMIYFVPVRDGSNEHPVSASVRRGAGVRIPTEHSVSAFGPRSMPQPATGGFGHKPKPSSFAGRITDTHTLNSTVWCTVEGRSHR